MADQTAEPVRDDDLAAAQQQEATTEDAAARSPPVDEQVARAALRDDGDNDRSDEEDSDEEDSDEDEGGERMNVLHEEARRGDVDAVMALILSGAAVNEKDSNERTALSYAAKAGCIGVVRELLKNGADPDTKDGIERTALSYAAQSGDAEVIAELIRSGADVDSRDQHGRAPLAYATSSETVKELIKNGALVDAFDDYRSTPMANAAKNGHAEAVSELIRHGAAIDDKDNFGRTPLSNAAKSGVVEIFIELLALGAAVEVKSKHGLTPLSHAADAGHVKMVAELIKNGAIVDSKDNDGKTPLSYAAESGHVDVMVELIKNGADPDTKDNEGRTALSFAAESGVADIVTELIRLGADVDAKDDRGRAPLAHADSTTVAKVLIKSGAALDARDNCGRTALSYAASSDKVEIVAELIRNGAEVDSKDEDGRTPLSFAAEFDRIGVITELIKSGADVNSKNKSGKSVMSQALTFYDTAEIVAELIRNGAVVDAKDLRGRTALSCAAKTGCLDVTKVLLANGATIDVKDASGKTPLLLATKNSEDKLALELIKSGADVNTKDNMGRTALSFAAETGRVQVVTKLVKSGVVVSDNDSSGRSALSYAGQKGHRAVVTQLFQHGAVDASGDSDDTVALFVAAVMGDLEPLQALLSKGLSVNATTNHGRTPLHYAAEFGKEDVVRLLIENGASVSVKASASPSGRECETPLSLAGRAGHVKIFQALIEAGSPVNVRTGGDGETPLISAARWGYFAGVRLLFAHGGCLRFDDVPDDETPLIQGTLETMRRLCAANFEFEQIYSRVSERLRAVCAQLQERDAAEVQKDILVSFASLIFRVCSQLLQVEKRALSRFIGIRGVIRRVQDHHHELDHFVKMMGLAVSEESWRAQLVEDRASLRERIEGVLRNEPYLISRGRFTSEKREAAMLLQYELKPRGEEVSAEAQESITRVLERFRRECDVEVAPVPEWFISRDDVEFDTWNVVRSERQLNYYDGKWRKTSVMIETSWRFDPDDLFNAASQWYPLNHPNVAKLFGVRHLGFPKFFVYEFVAEAKQLHEFLREESNRGLLWKCLYQVALGLQYLHSRDVVHEELRSENILVGSDLVPKLCGLRHFSPPNAHSGRRNVNWMAPEIERDSDLPTTAESNIFAFGVCIWEALALELPWKQMDGAAIRASLRDGKSPERPASIGDPEWDLITKMCAVNPSERVSIAYVVNRLKQFVLAGEQESLPTFGNLAIQNQDASVEKYVFAELEGATIPISLQSIRMRCEKLQEQQWMASNVLPALEYIFALLQERSKTPADVEVVTFCETLSRFQRYLRTAVSEKSVFELARSRQVAESHHVVYSDLDRLLNMLDVAETHLIRVWRTESTAESQARSAQAHGGADDNSAATTNESSSAVSLNYFDSPSANHEQWTSAGLAASSATPSWYLSLRELLFSEAGKIGQGAFGAVYRGSWLDTPVVVKFMGYEGDIATISTDLLLHEVRVWHRLSHPHVLKLYGACHADKRYFVCEFASNGDLVDYLNQMGGHSHLLWQKLYEAALGLEYLHGQNVAHNDLKCDNIMVGMDDKAKLIDFGLSCLVDEAEIQIDVKKMGAVHWKSPEYLAGGRPSFASDVYSFAMCIIEAVSGDIPWGKSVLPTMVRYRVKKGAAPNIPESMSDKQRHLIELMIKPDPTERVKMGFVVDKLHEIAQDEIARAAP